MPLKGNHRMNTYIDLVLLNTNTSDETFIKEPFSQNKNFVVLGAPGSGKTTLLKKLYQENIKIAKFLTVKELVHFDLPDLTDITTLILDGFDEYRGYQEDQAFAIKVVANKLNKVKCQIILSCRELDWYGDSDKRALESVLNKQFDVYAIQPLTEQQQVELIIELDETKEPHSFIERYQSTGLLRNPQLLSMLIKLTDNELKEVKDKNELYKQFIISFSRESNPEHKPQFSSNEELLLYNGYLAFMWLFSGAGDIDKHFLVNIASVSYDYEKLKFAYNSKIFANGKFLHRTLGEYLSASFLADKYKSGGLLEKERIKALFITGAHVKSDLRGCYSWLCSLTGDLNLIKLDPYYQLVYTENNNFSSEFKKQIIKCVKKHSETNPYFVNFKLNLNFDGFYQPELDEFLIEEIKENTELKNHYLLFLILIISTSSYLSEKMLSFVQSSLKEKGLNPALKSFLLKSNQVSQDFSLLNEVLELVVSNQIEDSQHNEVKEGILKLTYPDNMLEPTEQVVKALSAYKANNLYGQCNYLYKTKPKDLKGLISKLLSSFPQIKNTRNLYLEGEREPFKSISNFVLDAVFDICLLEHSKGSYQSLYSYLIELSSEVGERVGFQQLELSYEYKKKLEHLNHEFVKIANKLYETYIDLNYQQSRFIVFGFETIFPFAEPTNKFQIYCNKIDSLLVKNETEPVKNLFEQAYFSSTKMDEELAILKKIARKIGLEEDLEKWLNPHETTWQIKHKERELKLAKENAEKLKLYKNNYKNADSVVSDLDKLHQIYLIQDFEKHLIDDALNTVFVEVINKLHSGNYHQNIFTVRNLAERANNLTTVDLLMYESLSNPDVKVVIDENNLLIQYLYLLYVINKSVLNLEHPNHSFEGLSPAFRKSVLIEFISAFKTFDKDTIQLLSGLEHKELESLIYLHSKDEPEKLILERLLDIKNFNLDDDFLIMLKNEYHLLNAGYILDIKRGKALPKDEIANLTGFLFAKNLELNKFGSLQSGIKVKLLTNMLMVTIPEDFNNTALGIMTDYQSMLYFLQVNSLSLLDKAELTELSQSLSEAGFYSKSINWKYLIDNKITEISQQEADVAPNKAIDDLKGFLESNKKLTVSDYYIEFRHYLVELLTKIEANSDNEINSFYNTSYSKPIEKKSENECRDVLVNLLNQRLADKDYILGREKETANNRTDISVSNKELEGVVVQIECKLNTNKDIKKGISEQLIPKYMDKKAEHGIYLIFNFEGKVNINEIKRTIPELYKNRVEVFLLNLASTC